MKYVTINTPQVIISLISLIIMILSWHYQMWWLAFVALSVANIKYN